MTTVPEKPKIYHLTHLDNLSLILQLGKLLSDAARIEQGIDCEVVGMPEIKRRRLEELAVSCYPETKVGEYVPFYFCPRSIMLYILHKGNHQDITFRGGQRNLIHLMADLYEVVDWATRNHRRWSFSDRNAATRYAHFYNDVSRLDKINWMAVDATAFTDPDVKEGKQAEFLIENDFPWFLVERIGVIDESIRDQALLFLPESGHRPFVSIEREWYY